MRNLPTSCNFSLHLRQRRIEQSFADAFAAAGGIILLQHSLQSFTSDDSSVSCVVRNVKTGEDVTICAQYLVGADGGRSTVRRLANIEWIGDRTANKWIRMDALVETDMCVAAHTARLIAQAQLATAELDRLEKPRADALVPDRERPHAHRLCVLIMSATDRTDVFNAELQAKYGVDGADGLTEEIAIAEAQKGVAPFKLDFGKVRSRIRPS